MLTLYCISRWVGIDMEYFITMAIVGAGLGTLLIVIKHELMLSKLIKVESVADRLRHMK